MNIPLATIDEALRSEDIESLFQHGAPSDEYSAEARNIATELSVIGTENLSEQRVAEVICAVWDQSFGPFSSADIEARMSAFRQVARRILEKATGGD